MRIVKYIGRVGLLAIALVMITAFDCSNTAEMIERANTKIKPNKYLKKYLVRYDKFGSGKHITLPLNVNRGLAYKFYIQESDKAKGTLRVQLYGDEDYTRKLAGNYVEMMDKQFPSFEFKCNSSSKAYIDISFDTEVKECAIVMIGFRNI